MVLISDNVDASLVIGRDLVEAVAADFEALILPAGSFSLPYRFESIGFPSTKSDEHGLSYIALPNDMAAREITGPDVFFGYLLMLGHEIGHLVHRHEYGANAQTVEDFRSLEIWADWYGAKIATALVNSGRRTCALAGSPRFPEFADQVAAGVDFLVARVYKPHAKYPPALERAGLAACGVLSYLRRWLGSLEPDVVTGIIVRILRAPSIAGLVEREGASAIFDDAELFRATQWHRNMQRDQKALQLHFRPDVAAMLHTSFDRTDEEICEARDQLLRDFRSDGFDV